MTIRTLDTTQGLLSDAGTSTLPPNVDITTTNGEAPSTSTPLTTTLGGLNSTSIGGSSSGSNASVDPNTFTIFSSVSGGLVGLDDIRGWAVLLSTLSLGFVFYYH